MKEPIIDYFYSNFCVVRGITITMKMIMFIKIGAKFNLSLHIEVAEMSTKEIEKKNTAFYEESLLASDENFLTVC